MKALALILLIGCEHDPRYEQNRHIDEGRPAIVVPKPPAPLVNATIQRPPVFAAPKPHRHHHH